MAAYLVKHSQGTMAITAKTEQEAKIKAIANGAIAVKSVKKISKS